MNMEITAQSINILQILLSLLSFITLSYIGTIIFISKRMLNSMDDFKKEVSMALKEIGLAMHNVDNTIMRVEANLKADIASHKTEIEVLKSQMASAVERRKEQR